MSQRSPVVHDGQGDAMPCECPACRSPFTIQRNPPPHRSALRIVPIVREPEAVDHLRGARAC